MYLTEYITNKLKVLLQEHRQQDLAEMIGVHRTAISMYINGSREFTWEFVQKFLEAFPVHIMDAGTNMLEEPEARYERLAKKTRPMVRHIPAKAAAGDILTGVAGTVMEDEIKAYDFPGLTKGPEYWSMQVTGDSMHPTISDEEMIFISQVEKLEENKR